MSNSVFYFLLSPGFYFLLILLLFYRYWFKWSAKVKSVLLTFYFIVIYFMSTPFVIDALLWRLERKNKPFLVNEIPQDSNLKIVVLGTGFNHDSRLPAATLLGHSARARLVEGIRIANHFPNAMVITSGHSASGKTSGAETLRDAAIELGLSKDRIFIQDKPHNTKAEAKAFSELYYSTGDTVVLVTSSSHINRAIQHFQNQGVSNIIAAPCDFNVFQDNTYRTHHFIPSFSYWSKYQKLNKEFIGSILNL